MPDLPTLSGPSLPPADGGPPRKLVILLHGVGADGNDLIGLAPYFQHILPDALFVSPNAPYAFDMAPFGYQWFSLQDLQPDTRLRGTQAAAPILDAYIDSLLTAHGLSEDKLVLVGFSQGAMMALHVGLRRTTQLAGIVSYSGMLAGDQALLASEIKSRPPVSMTHGAEDPVLPVQALPIAVAALKSVGIEVESHVRPGLGHGLDEDCVYLGMDFLKRVLGDGETE